VNRIKRRAVGTYTFTATAENENGEAEAISAPVTVTIRDGAGTVKVTDTPTISAGKLTYVADAANLPLLDTYEITWTGVVDDVAQEWVTEVELVGDYYFEVSELRAMDRAFLDETKYPTEYLQQVRAAVEDVIEGERAANVAFVPRGRRVSVNGKDGWRDRTEYGIDMPDFNVSQVYSLTSNGTAFTNDQIAALDIEDATLWNNLPWPFGRRNVSVHYVHGYKRVPREIKRAALILAKDYLVLSPLPGRATATSIGDQMFRLTVAGRDGVTGLPEVDAAIKDLGRFGRGLI
jgi:hypothetical protein